MIKKSTILRFSPQIIISGIVILLISSFIIGNSLVKKSEKELNPNKQINEAQAATYSLKEIDTKSGELRWELTAKEGKTEHNLKAVLIKDIDAKVYKKNKVIFELHAPHAKANTSTKDIYLFGEVTAKDTEGKFLLKSNQLALGMNTSIEAQNGFSLILKDSGTLTGENAFINDDQTQIIVKDLNEALFKEVTLSGKKVTIIRDTNGALNRALLSKGGKVVLKDQKNNSLSADTIEWEKSGEIKAIKNVTYTSGDKIFKAGYLLIKPDKKIYAKNNVSIIHSDTQCYGNSLSFEDESLIVISGKPKAIQGDKQITADKIAYNLNSGKVEAFGNVKTTVTEKSRI